MPVNPNTALVANPFDNGPSEERFRVLESRLLASERTNRSLLDEVVRLQGTVRQALRRQEDLLRDDRSAKDQLQVLLNIANASKVCSRFPFPMQNTRYSVYFCRIHGV